MIKKTIAAAITMGVMAAGSAQAFQDDELVIWVNGDKGYKGMQLVGDKFTEETGIKVRVEHPEGVTDKFQQSAASGSGPDIFIWPHDRFGEWAKAGLISEVKPSAEFVDGIADFSWSAVTIKGKKYGYPIAMEAVGLIYNKDLLPEAPKSFEEMFALKGQLKSKTIMWDYNNTYFSWPILAANGGYVFAQDAAGDYLVKDTGVNNPGALKGLKLIKKLIDDGVMDKGVDYSVMDAAFNKGEVAMMINGPWAWKNLKDSKMNFGVAAIPTVDGKPGKAFVGVLAATLNSAGTNKELAQEFLESYLLSIDGLKAINADVPLGAVANKEYMKELSSDANIAATFKNAQNGKPMPNVPEMGKFWSAMGPAISNSTNGRQKPEAALNDAAKRILN